MQKREIIYAQNIAQFKILVSSIRSFGESYKTDREMFKLSSLETVLNDARLALKEVRRDTAALAVAARRRETVFDGLDNLAARIGYVMEISRVYYFIGSDARRIIYKLQGKFAVETVNADDYKITTKAKPDSKLSFENRIACFEKLIKLLESGQSAYAPEEEDLTPAALRRRVSEMRRANSAVINAGDCLGCSRMVCDEVLFDKESGLIIVADQVMTYIQSFFGKTSPQHKKIKKLEFRKITN